MTATGGYAYGTIGADIHVFGNGTPVYVLENHQPAPRTDPQWLREAPSRMLNARFQVVGFTGRDDELAELRRWRDEGPRMSVRWLHAPGGQGKSRLADCLADDSAASGWKAVTAVHGPGAVLRQPGGQDLRLHDATGVLLIVDYADHWPASHLAWLFSNALLHQTSVPARILLLARTDYAWPTVRAMLADFQAATSSRLLSPLSEDTGRAEMFTTARDCFAAAYGLIKQSLADSHPPAFLKNPDMGLTLAVHMAALVAVDAHATGPRRGHRLPQTVEGLTVYLLDREHLHWARLSGDVALELEPGERTYRTAPSAMNQAVFAAALSGTVSRSTAVDIVGALRLPPSPEQVTADHAVCYPPPADAQNTAFEPLAPDRLAEDFLALTLPGHRADYPAQPWAAATLSTLLARHGASRDRATCTPRAVTFLAAAASRWSHLGAGHLFPLLRHDPQLALDAGAAALIALAALGDASITVLEGIESRFPAGRHADLDLGIAAVTERLTRHRLARTDDPAEQAALYEALAGRQENAGLHAQALQSTDESIRRYRRLADADPGAYQPGLVRALTNRGVHLSALGQRTQAVDATEQAVRLAVRHRGDHGTQPNRVAPSGDLAAPLSNLGNHLLAVGRLQEALDATLQATDIFGRLADAYPDMFTPDFARMLVNAGILLSMTGQPAEALQSALAATHIYGRLAAAAPSHYNPLYADALATAGNHLWLTGRLEEACQATLVAVDIRRGLAQANPSAFQAALARSLTDLSVYLSKVGHHADALGTAQEATDHWRQLAAALPAKHESSLGIALSNLGNRLAAVGRAPEALTITEEAVRLLERLDAAEPGFHEDALAKALTNLGNRLSARGRTDKVVSVVQCAVDVYQRLSARHPAAYQAALARVLSNLGLHLAAVGKHEEAVASALRAETLCRRLAQADSAAADADLALSLRNLALVQLNAPQSSGTLPAFQAAQEALGIYRRLAAVNPTAFGELLEAAKQVQAEALHALSRIR